MFIHKEQLEYVLRPEDYRSPETRRLEVERDEVAVPGQVRGQRHGMPRGLEEPLDLQPPRLGRSVVLRTEDV
ncbi:MAG: hypothetical protein ACKOTB_07740, partial [Planctomycetia bacterium]